VFFEKLVEEGCSGHPGDKQPTGEGSLMSAYQPRQRQGGRRERKSLVDRNIGSRCTAHAESRALIKGKNIGNRKALAGRELEARYKPT
jgi:hypothetical protein